MFYQGREIYGKPMTLVFNKEKLLYDISNYAFVEGELVGEDNEKAHHLVTDIAQKGNIDRLTSVLSLAYSECIEMLYPFASRKIAEGADVVTNTDNDLSDEEEYVIMLSLPQGFAMNTVEYVSKLLHEYMVCRVLQDWLDITFPNSAAKWAIKMEDIKTKLRAALLARRRVIRRKYSPF